MAHLHRPALGGVALFALLVAGCGPTPPAPTGSGDTGIDFSALPVLEDSGSEPWTPTTRTDELALQLDAAQTAGGSVDLQLAVDAFDLSVAPMPGATPATIDAGAGVGPSYAIALLSAHLDELSIEQRLVYNAVVGVPEAVIGTDGEVIDEPAGTTGTASLRPTPVHVGPSKAVKKHELAVLAAMYKRWTTRLPGEMTFTLAVGWSTTDLNPASGGTASMATLRHGPTDPVCHITIFPTEWKSPDLTYLRIASAHEIFHCIQNSWIDIATVPDWVIEGSANWASSDLLRTERHDFPEGTDQWFTAPEKPLGARVYDGWGVYEAYHEQGGPTLLAIRALIQAGPVDVAARLRMAGMDTVQFRTAWATRSTRLSLTTEDRWHLQLPTNPGSSGARDNIRSSLGLSIGHQPMHAEPQFAHGGTYRQVDRAVGITTVAAYDAPLSVVNGANTITVGEGDSVRLCWDSGGCVCPDGSSSGAIRMQTDDFTSAFSVSEIGGYAMLTNTKWSPKDYCDDPDEAANSNGDPHLRTYDGLPFDVNALGEFVLTRVPNADPTTTQTAPADPADAADLADADAAFEVQTRHESFGADVVATGLVEAGAVGTSAVAIGVDDHRITLTADTFDWESPVAVRVDGQQVTDAQRTVGDTTIAANSVDPQNTADYRVWTLTRPDGTDLTITWAWGFFVETSLPPERAAGAVGLLGGGNHDFTDDLLLPNGSALPMTDDLDDVYAEAWRVDATTSLFDYAPGESVATFDLPTPDPLEIEQEARDFCETALPEHSTTYELAGCAYDYTVTGIDGFGTTWSDVAVEPRIAETGADGFGLPGSSASIPPTTSGLDPRPPLAGTPSLVLTGSIDLSSVGVEGAVHIPRGSVVLLRATGCPADVELWADVWPLDDPDNSALMSVCDPDGLNDYTERDGDENVPAESYALTTREADFGFSLDTNAEVPWNATLEVFVDPQPVVAEVSDTDAVAFDGTLSGVADTALIEVTGEGAPTWNLTGGDTGCFVIDYADPIDDAAEAIRFLDGVCHHGTQIALSPLVGATLPMVLFTRTDDSVRVAMRLQ